MHPSQLLNSGAMSQLVGQPQVATPFDQVVNRLWAEVDNLQHEIEQLTTRLVPYLADVPPGPTPGKPEIPYPVPNSPALCRLSDINSRLMNLSSDLACVKRKLEL